MKRKSKVVKIFCPICDLEEDSEEKVFENLLSFFEK